MNTYDVIIQGVVTKTIRVDAENEEEAENLATTLFTTETDEYPEDYQESVEYVRLVSQA